MPKSLIMVAGHSGTKKYPSFKTRNVQRLIVCVLLAAFALEHRIAFIGRVERILISKASISVIDGRILQNCNKKSRLADP
jgi:hypothetical protein